jgi:group I intron endonuclease
MVGIYKITNPTGKIYIGQSVNIDKRKSAYKRMKCEDQPSIYRSLKKHGWENHIFEIIEECNICDLQTKEIYWKKYYLNEINGDWSKVLFCKLDDGPGGHLTEDIKQKISVATTGKKRSNEFKKFIRERQLGSKHSDATKQKMKKPRRDTTNMKGKKQSPSHIEKRISKIKGIQKDPNPYLGINSKEIFQFDLKGNFIKKWNSIIEAEKTYGKGIKSNLSGKTMTSRGYIWSYNQELIHSLSKIENKWKSKSKPVIQSDLNGKFIKEWEKILDIENELGFHNTGITSCCRGKQKTAYGFKWEYK